MKRSGALPARTFALLKRLGGLTIALASAALLVWLLVDSWGYASLLEYAMGIVLAGSLASGAWIAGLLPPARLTRGKHETEGAGITARAAERGERSAV